MNVNGSVLSPGFFSPSFFLSYLYIHIYHIRTYMDVCVCICRWDGKKEGEMFSSEATLVSKVIEGRARLLIVQKKQPTCMCVCDNDTVKINKILYSR